MMTHKELRPSPPVRRDVANMAKLIERVALPGVARRQQLGHVANLAKLSGLRFACLTACLAICAVCPRAAAWNPLGHKLVCEIAWQELQPETRKRIADTLKRHPRFAEDFAPDMPAEDADRWIFWQAGFWPDIARDIPEDVRPQFNHPTWHYVNHPLFLGPVRRVSFNLSTIPAGPRENWNLYQSTQHNLDVLRSDAPPQEKALAYCWVMHLVGDMHLPLHCVTLVCDRFPTGDKGGSVLKVLNEKKELHGLWDCLLGDAHDRTAVLAAYQKLKTDPGLWNVDTSGNFKDWMLESRELAESLTYSPEILAAIEQSTDGAPIPMSADYLQRAGAAARARVVAAGLRLAAVLEQP